MVKALPTSIYICCKCCVWPWRNKKSVKCPFAFFSVFWHYFLENGYFVLKDVTLPMFTALRRSFIIIIFFLSLARRTTPFSIFLSSVTHCSRPHHTSLHPHTARMQTKHTHARAAHNIKRAQLFPTRFSILIIMTFEACILGKISFLG